ncbi:helix-turn-helix domain-containing protein [Roseibium algae]|uniref:Helix-turn-helix domain-containing protein n=1 Tax=Roseibium algae TaxID=3123038 RepID=A0ABU8TIC7_9HYPH
MNSCWRTIIPHAAICRPGNLIRLLADNRTAAHLHLAEGYVARAYCIRPEDLYQKTRGRAHVAEARHLVMYLSHVEIGMRLIEVARRYNRDRSTVAYACRRIEDGRDDPSFDMMVCQIEQLISMRDESSVPAIGGAIQ